MYDDIDEDYYKPIKINSAFNDDYIEYESNVIRIKFYQLKNILI